MTKEKVFDWIKSIFIALVIALFIRAFIVEAFKIPSSSMENTLLIGDHILVNRFIYGVKMPFTGYKIIPVKEPKRGDVVVFKFPPNPKIYFIKRCIGTPGDTLKMINKVLYVNGRKVIEPFVIHKDPNICGRNRVSLVCRTRFGSRDNWGPVVVPKGKYFMMGDNRDNSYDSRYWGFVPEKNISGKAFIIYGSWTWSPFNIKFNRFFKLIKNGYL